MVLKSSTSDAGSGFWNCTFRSNSYGALLKLMVISSVTNFSIVSCVSHMFVREREKKQRIILIYNCLYLRALNPASIVGIAYLCRESQSNRLYYLSVRIVVQKSSSPALDKFDPLIVVTHLHFNLRYRSGSTDILWRNHQPPWIRP